MGKIQSGIKTAEESVSILDKLMKSASEGDQAAAETVRALQ